MFFVCYQQWFGMRLVIISPVMDATMVVSITKTESSNTFTATHPGPSFIKLAILVVTGITFYSEQLEQWYGLHQDPCMH